VPTWSIADQIRAAWGAGGGRPGLEGKGEKECGSNAAQLSWMAGWLDGGRELVTLEPCDS